MKSNKNKSNKPIQEWSKPKGGLRENDPPSVWEPSYRNTKKLQLSEMIGCWQKETSNDTAALQ